MIVITHCAEIILKQTILTSIFLIKFLITGKIATVLQPPNIYFDI